MNVPFKDTPTEARDQILGFAAALKSQGKQPATVESYCRDVSAFVDYLGQQHLRTIEVDASTLIAYQEYLRDVRHEKGNSIRRNVIGVRQFYRFLTDQKSIVATPFDIVAIPERVERLPEHLATEQIEAMITSCQKGAPAIKAARDAAIVGLISYEGLKANEIIGLQWKDLLLTEEAPTLRLQGNRTRVLMLSARTAELLRAYREQFDRSVDSATSESGQRRVFIAFKGRDSAQPVPTMTRHGLKFIIYELGDRMGISHLNAEILRHHAIDYQLGNGKSSDEVMSHLGLKQPGLVAKHAAWMASKKDTAAHSLTLPTAPAPRDVSAN